jgi:hypothetical protein
MTMTRWLCAAGFLCLLPAAGVFAQTITIQRPPVDPVSSPVRVQVSVNLFVPGPTNDSEQANALRERATRSMYAIAAGECDILRDKLADDCRMENVNVNISRQRQPIDGQQLDGLQVNGTFGYRITQKAGISP